LWRRRVCHFKISVDIRTFKNRRHREMGPAAVRNTLPPIAPDIRTDCGSWTGLTLSDKFIKFEYYADRFIHFRLAIFLLFK
jgi:hypothetical protein